jgi:hypothetical protein
MCIERWIRRFVRRKREGKRSCGRRDMKKGRRRWR